MKKGLFISFEGIDGCGKSLMTELSAKFLREQGHDVLITREPGGSVFGQQLRKVLLDSEKGSVSATAEALLFAADRADHCENMIRPALEQGKIVLCDRFLDSTIAYQHFGRRIDRQKLDQLNAFAINGLLPQKTILLNISPEKAASRLVGERDRMEQENGVFFQAVADGYLTLAKEFPDRFCVVDAEQDIPDVFRNIQNILMLLLKG